MLHKFTFRSGQLIDHVKVKVREAKKRGVPAGLALNKAGSLAFVANIWGNSISVVGLDQRGVVKNVLLGTNLDAGAEAPVQPSPDPDTAAAQKRAEAALYERDATGTFPYSCSLDESRHRLYVSLWSRARVAVVDLDSLKVLAQWPTQDHPCEMALTRSGKILFVANASRNTVTVFDAPTGRTLEIISSSLYPEAPPGSTPNSLALSPDEHTLFIANADNNTVAVFDVSSPGKSRSLGFIPAGWYPTSVRVTPDGKKLLVANGKGLVPSPNPPGAPARN